MLPQHDPDFLSCDLILLHQCESCRAVLCCVVSCLCVNDGWTRRLSPLSRFVPVDGHHGMDDEEGRGDVMEFEKLSLKRSHVP